MSWFETTPAALSQTSRMGIHHSWFGMGHQYAMWRQTYEFTRRSALASPPEGSLEAVSARVMLPAYVVCHARFRSGAFRIRILI
jgi:hypothetical protein